MVVANHIMRGIDERIAEHGVAAFGHSGAACRKIARLHYSRVKACKSKELGGTGETGNVPDDGKNHCAIDVPDPRDCHNGRIEVVHNAGNLVFHLVKLFGKQFDLRYGLVDLQSQGWMVGADGLPCQFT